MLGELVVRVESTLSTAFWELFWRASNLDFPASLLEFHRDIFVLRHVLLLLNNCCACCARFKSTAPQSTSCAC